MLTAAVWKDGVLARAEDAVGVREALASGAFVWVDLTGAEAEVRPLLEALIPGHPLALADCLAESRVPKLNGYGDLVHMVIHGSSPAAEEVALKTRELDLLWTDRLLLTVHAQPLRSVNAVRDRLLKEPGALMGGGPAVLLYEVLDTLVDNWFPFVEAAGVRLDRIDKAFTPRASDRLRGLSRDVAALASTLERQREVLDRLSREDVPGVPAPRRVYFRHLQDRVVALRSELELLREQIRSVRESHLLEVSNRLNRTMKVLTVFSSVLMPMTLVAGIYGMNFRHMPELGWAFGYPFALGLMAGSGLLTWYWVRKL